MVASPSVTTEAQKKALDSLALLAYNSPILMKFIQVAVDTFERHGTMKLTLHVKDGEPKGGDGTFSF